jgi:hypothetical protein
MFLVENIGCLKYGRCVSKSTQLQKIIDGKFGSFESMQKLRSHIKCTSTHIPTRPATLMTYCKGI